MGDFLKSSFGKMFMELLARHREKTSEQSLKLSGKSARETIAFLDMRKTSKDGKNGRTPASSWEIVPHKDSAEYKMWGNGMAFPCMLYIMEGVQEVLVERYLDNLFGGDTAEP